MKMLISLFIVVFVTVHAEGQASGKPNVPAPSARGTVLLDDQTIYENTADLAEYKKGSRLTGHIRSNGDPSAVNLWAEEFKKIYPDVTFDIQLEGHKQGWEMLLQGKIDLVPIARRLKDKEIAEFKKQFGYEPTQIGVSFDALGIYVHKDNPIEQLTLQQLDAIYSAELRRGGKAVETWGDLGVTGALSHQRILRFCIGTRRGVRSLFKNVVMLDGDYRVDVQLEKMAGSLVQAVGANNAGIAFAGVFYATHRTKFVKMVGEDGRALLPIYTNVVTGEYPLSLMLYFVVNKKPKEPLSPHLLEFMRFVTSRSGQRSAALIGHFPLTSKRQEESRLQFE